MEPVVFDANLIRKYDTTGPRYTSYPTAPQFHEGFGEAEQRLAIARADASDRPLSVYVHLPFCDTVCYFCGCNKVVTKRREKALPYLQALYRNMHMVTETMTRVAPLHQLHFGGGTPTFLSDAELAELIGVLKDHFAWQPDGEYSIETDPREVNDATIALLADLGFSRMSLGVQDFDPQVQRAVNRIQSEAITVAAVEAGRRHGFRSINLDLMYGLPLQTVAGFTRTLQRVIAISPDRLTVFNYAHLPHMFKPQRRINEADLPSPAEKLAMLSTAIAMLVDAGYVYIGMDHFAKPDDELTLAQRNGTLYRNFQGYSTHADCDLYAFGVSAISQIDNTYCQNVRDLPTYYAHIDAGRWPVFRGVTLTADDQLRREVITRLMCDFRVDMAAIGQHFAIDWQQYFAEEVKALRPLVDDGLATWHGACLSVSGAGRLLIRHVAMVFDVYLRRSSDKEVTPVATDSAVRVPAPGFSRVI